MSAYKLTLQGTGAFHGAQAFAALMFNTGTGDPADAIKIHRINCNYRLSGAAAVAMENVGRDLCRISSSVGGRTVGTAHKFDSNAAGMPSQVIVKANPQSATIVSRVRNSFFGFSNAANNIDYIFPSNPNAPATVSGVGLPIGTMATRGGHGAKIFAKPMGANGIRLQEGQGLGVILPIFNRLDGSIRQGSRPMAFYDFEIVARIVATGALYVWRSPVLHMPSLSSSTTTIDVPIVSIMNGSGSGVVLEVLQVNIAQPWTFGTNQVGADGQGVVTTQLIEGVRDYFERSEKVIPIAAFDTATPCPSDIVGYTGPVVPVHYGERCGAYVSYHREANSPSGPGTVGGPDPVTMRQAYLGVLRANRFKDLSGLRIDNDCRYGHDQFSPSTAGQLPIICRRGFGIALTAIWPAIGDGDMDNNALSSRPSMGGGPLHCFDVGIEFTYMPSGRTRVMSGALC